MRRKCKFLIGSLTAIAMLSHTVTDMSGLPQNGKLNSINASAWICGDWNYGILDSELNTISLLTYYGTDNNVVTPKTLDGRSVVYIGVGIFKNNESLENVVISEGITELGSEAFWGCTELRSAELPSTLTAIGLYSFADTAITSIKIPERVAAISDNAFDGCSNLESVILSDELTTIGAYAFRNTAIKSIVIPETVTEIGTGAFIGCDRLESVIIKGDTKISTDAFNNCPKLVSLTIEGKADLNSHAFANCTGLTNVNINLESTLTGTTFDGCCNLQSINDIEAVCIDPATGATNFAEELNDFIMSNFSSAKDIGFIDTYVENKALSVVNQMTNNNMSDIEKAKALHDWVCNKVVYDNNTKTNKNHTEYSIFLNDSTVCDGYAKGYNLLLRVAGLESCCAHKSGAHIWNIIKLGNHYFHVDPTWDDYDGGWNYDWFLKSDAELKEAGAAHSEWTLFTGPLMYDNISDTLPECNYSMGDLNMDGAVDENDLLLLNDYLLGRTDIDSGDIVLADLNFDGSIDSYDLAAMRKMIV